MAARPRDVILPPKADIPQRRSHVR